MRRDRYRSIAADRVEATIPRGRLGARTLDGQSIPQPAAGSFQQAIVAARAVGDRELERLANSDGQEGDGDRILPVAGVIVSRVVRDVVIVDDVHQQARPSLRPRVVE